MQKNVLFLIILLASSATFALDLKRYEKCLNNLFPDEFVIIENSGWNEEGMKCVMTAYIDGRVYENEYFLVTFHIGNLEYDRGGPECTDGYDSQIIKLPFKVKRKKLYLKNRYCGFELP